MYEALTHSMETQAALRDFSEMLTSTLELESLAEKAMEQFMIHTSALGGAILYESDGALQIAASRGLKEPGGLIGSDHLQVALKSGKSQRIKLPEDIQVEGVLADFRPSEVFVIPATYKEVPLGVVVLGKASAFDRDERIRIELFKQGFGLALNNALIHNRLHRWPPLGSPLAASE